MRKELALARRCAHFSPLNSLHTFISHRSLDSLRFFRAKAHGIPLSSLLLDDFAQSVPGVPLALQEEFEDDFRTPRTLRRA